MFFRSFGTIMYMLVTGELPIAGDCDSEILGNVARLLDHPKKFGAIANLVPGVDISVECSDFINRLMEVNTKSRLTTADALNHPWIKVRHGCRFAGSPLGWACRAGVG